MKKDSFQKLGDLADAYRKAKSKYELSIELLKSHLEKVAGFELQVTDFPDDGLGVGLGSESDDTYAPISQLLKTIEETGTLTKQDILDRCCL